jgi:hypothetical protein
MRNIIISFVIGLAAAAVDITPMIIKKIDIAFIFSAFFFWVILGFLIPRADIIPISWLNGVIVAWLLLIPLLFLIYKYDKNSIPLIIITTIILGAGVGIVSNILLK